MTVLEILKLASKYAEINDELSPIFNGEDEISDEATKIYNDLLLSLNSILHELATTKFKPKKVLSYSSNGQTVISLSNIHQNIIKIIRIFNKNGDVDFKIVDESVSFNSNIPVCIQFSYIPSVSSLNDKVNEFNFIGAKILAMGVVGEYYLISGIFDDASYFKNEFLDGVRCCLDKNYHIRARRWK